MLPDLPKFKGKIADIQNDFLRETVNQNMGAMDGVRRTVMFEGDRQGVRWSSGGGESHEFERMSAGTSFKPEDGLEEIFVKFAQMGKEIADQSVKMVFRQLGETMDKTGQTIDGKGVGLLEGMYMALEAIQLPLDDNGKLDTSNVSFVVGPGAYKKFEALYRELESDPVKLHAHETRVAVIMKKKEEEAYAREANRKLVG